MKKVYKYEDSPAEVRDSLKSARLVADFLPPPEKLILKEDTKKITIVLSKKSVDFFKEKSKKANVPYQQMIRKVLDTYTDIYGDKNQST